ncbi:hypothetical protein POX_d05812 [Penicillium oxalicum]|uniref:hypothetical protein n=1 Tax=Penicillium oxalicum TaxID=69781 RepID=UPI0020B75808|nr:hypothetical protein POX_d05812 [Penicillium oxalicum]KAI2790303.1 hypothetical protein POX_d05812 [Penicillium oxalicum]
MKYKLHLSFNSSLHQQSRTTALEFKNSTSGPVECGSFTGRGGCVGTSISPLVIFREECFRKPPSFIRRLPSGTQGNNCYGEQTPKKRPSKRTRLDIELDRP